MSKPSYWELALRPGSRSPAPAPLAHRQPALVGCRADAVSALAPLKVAVFGTGSVGGRFSTNLARLQPLEIWLSDPKPYSSTSSSTHDSLPRLCGASKCLHVGRLCKTIHPSTRVFVFPGRAQELSLDALVDVDLGFMAPDNLPAEMAIGQRFLNLGKPLIHAAVHGDTLTAQVRVYLNKDGSGPCPACGFGRLEWDQLAREVQYSCEGHRSGAPLPRPPAQATRSFAHLCSLASDLALNQLTRLVLGLGRPVGDTLLEYCGHTNATVVSALSRNQDCLCHHCRFAMVRAPLPWAECTLEKLSQEAGCARGPEDLAFTVDGRTWFERGACGCSQPSRVGRFVKTGPAAPRLRRCGRCLQPVRPHPLHSYPEVPAAVLGPSLAIPLGALGASSPRWIRIRGRDRSALVLPHNLRKGSS